jgi:ectoine hydroxylase-related dioxygenase (phytanoyl-CoA dioxygenase family)
MLSQEQAQAFDEKGYFVISDAIGPEELAALVEEIDPYEAADEAFLREKMGGKHLIARAGEITFTNHLVAKSARIRHFVSGPLFQDLCYDLIGPDVRLYWDMAVYKKPGTIKPFPWHQDNGYTFVEPQQYLTCWIALSDATVDNGCVWVLPGVHRLGTVAHRFTDLGFVCIEGQPPDATPVPLKAGSIAVMSSLTPHATGPNTSDGVRKALIAEFAPEGAVTVRRDPKNGTVKTRCNAARQIPILESGRSAN